MNSYYKTKTENPLNTKTHLRKIRDKSSVSPNLLRLPISVYKGWRGEGGPRGEEKGEHEGRVGGGGGCYLGVKESEVIES